MELEFETILGILMIIVGVISLLFVLKANSKFPAESELRMVTSNVITVIIFLTAFSLWHVVREAFHLKKLYGEVIEYPEYAFIILTFIMLFKTAKHLYDSANRLGLTE
jgi:hypothetical protein